MSRTLVLGALTSMALAVGGTALATPAQAQDCGFSFAAQSYTNCGSTPGYVVYTWYDSFQGIGGTTFACTPVGTTPTIALVGPGKLVQSAGDIGEPCTPIGG